MNKKIFAALISVLMVCTVLPVLPVSAVTESYGLVLTDDPQGLYTAENNQPFTNDGSWSWDNDTNTLTLMNFEFITSFHTALETLDHMQITINVPYGESTISSENFSGTGYIPHGIFSPGGTVSFTGSGTLNVLSGTSTNNPGASIAIDAKAVNCDELTLNATAGDATNGNSYGIRCQDLTVDGGRVNATGGTVNGTGNYSMGLNATGATEIYGGTLIATGGNSSAASAVSSGIYGGDLYIEDGIVNATGGQADFSYGISPDGGGDVIMNGGTLLAQGGTAAESAGIYGADEITIGANIVSAIMQGHTAAVGAYQSMTSATEIIYTDDNDYDGGNKVSVSNLDNFDSALYIECIGTPIIIGGNETAAEEPKPEPENKPYYSNTPPPSPPTASLALIEYIDNEKVGEISLHLTSNMQKFSSYVRINSNRTAQTEEYIKSNWNVTALGSFETAQRGGWGDIATLSVSLEDLGFEVSNGTKLYVLIFDTKNKIWHEVEAIIENGEVVIVTEYSGIFGIVNEKVI